MFAKLLIANRGEIACRVARTARRLGVRTVAVFSDADADALHVALADEAVAIGPAPARESYLDAGRVLAAARATGAEAIHPGYGFLSENAEFAQAVGDAGLTFVGPPPAAIRAMGDKAAAKAIMGAAEVPLVPGYHGDDQDDEALAAAAEDTGFPLLIKASAGGGGKGMRVVESAAGFCAALDAARREAKAAFGDDRVLLEAFLDRPRHIEVQVFADGQGNTVHLFERDCSIQRRHQKVIEEAPAPGLSPQRREELGAIAVRAARAIDYVGAGTVEFIADRDVAACYFMEMNTRLQVEHPVTELVTGLDLVEWQLRVAAGEPLPAAQDAIELSGHALEARLYAEDPGRDFLPATGRLNHLRLPAEGPAARVDGGVAEGDTVGIHYDPMLAKLIAWGPDRATALVRLRSMLAETRVGGVTTNLGLLDAVAAHPAFAAADIDTGFIAHHSADLLPESGPADDAVLALATLGVLLDRREVAAAAAAASGDPTSPWHGVDGWRLNDRGHDDLRFRDGEREVTVSVHYDADGYALTLPGGTLKGRAERDGRGDLVAELDGRRLRAAVLDDGTEILVLAAGVNHRLARVDPLAAAAAASEAAGGLTAPMPGKVVAVHVAPGEDVARGAPLMVLEAMKMEHSIAAPAAGIVAAVHFAEGDQVEEGAALLTLDLADD